MASNHLEDIVNRQNGSSSLQVVFSDIVSFSKRKTAIQREVIDKFTELNEKAIEMISQKYISAAQKLSLNFASDLIKIPTGDGLALAIH